MSRVTERARGCLLEAVETLVLTLIIFLVIQNFVAQPYQVEQMSMENTLLPGQYVLVDKLTPHFEAYKRGDIVVFIPPGGDPGSVPFIKRVIGLPGDRVACCDSSGRVTVNGTPLQEAGYLYPGDAPSALRFSVLVPPGKLWVMGDHRAVSQDSRAHLGDPGGGFVPIDRVVGRAFATVWPPQRWRLLGTPATFASVHAAWACRVPGVAPTAAVVAGNPGLAATACSRWPLGASRSPLPGPQQRGRTVRG